MTKRDAIIGLYRAGTPISKIIKQLKLPKSTAYDAVRRYNELGNTKVYPESGRSRSCHCHQSRPKEGKEVLQTLHLKMAPDFKWTQNQ